MKEILTKFHNIITQISEKSIIINSGNRLKTIFKKSKNDESKAVIDSLQNIEFEDHKFEKTLPRIRRFKAETVNSDQEIEKTITKRLRRESQSKQLKEQWVITVVAGHDKGRQYLATTSQLKVGRKSDNHIYLKDPKVSRYHALLKLKGTKWYIRDLQSTNGTRVNNQKVVGEKELAPGAQITIGDTIIEIQKIDS